MSHPPGCLGGRESDQGHAGSTHRTPAYRRSALGGGGVATIASFCSSPRSFAAGWTSSDGPQTGKKTPLLGSTQSSKQAPASRREPASQSCNQRQFETGEGGRGAGGWEERTVVGEGQRSQKMPTLSDTGNWRGQ